MTHGGQQVHTAVICPVRQGGIDERPSGHRRPVGNWNQDFTGQIQPGSRGGGGMSFDTPAGTRGGRQPRAGLILRLINKNAASQFRRKGKMLGFNGLILTTVGARSGAERTSPVGWWPGPDGSWLIVAAANGGARNPAWYHNIAAHPDNVQIQVDGRRIGVTAEQLHGPERAQAWQQIAAATPRFAQYQDKTDRELPVIRLVPPSG